MFAYIDPVSGSIILQVIVAGTLGAVGYFRKSLWRMICFIIRRPPNEQPPAE